MKRDRYIEIGSRLRELRKRYGLTQQQVSDALGIERSKYAYYEKETRPDLECLMDIAKIYGIDVDCLINGEKEKIEVDGVASAEVYYETDCIDEDKISDLSKVEKSILLKFRLMNFKEKQEVKDFIEDIRNRE